MIAFPPSTAAVVSFNTFVDNVLTDFDSAPTIILDRNESASGVTVTVTNEGSGWYKASFTTGAWTSGDRLRLRVSVGALNSVSQVGAIVWEGVIDELVSSRLAPSTAGRTIDVDANGYVERVVLCDTTTTNSDMRGTDNAILASSAPSNFGDLAITASTGKVTVGTNDDKAGYSLAADQSGVTIGTVNAMAGTIQTLDALDTAQDTQHSTTQSAIAGLSIPTAAAIRSEIDSNSTQLAAIIADTNDLQTNQGNWLTADVSGLATASALATVGSNVNGIKAVTDKVDTGLEDDGASGYQWTTLALENGPSGSGLDAAGVRAAVGLASANLDTQLGNIVADTNELQADLTDGGRLDLIFDGILEDTGTTIPAAISGISGGAGSGARSVTITVDDGTDPLEAANVRVTQGAESYVQPTDANGQIVFSLDDATWTVTVTKAGYTLAPQSLVVDGTETVTYSMSAVSITPSSAGFVTGYAVCYDASGSEEAGVTCYLQLIELPSSSTGVALESQARTATSNGSGIAQWTGLLPGATYEIWRGTTDTKRRYSIASDASGNVEVGSFYGVD